MATATATTTKEAVEHHHVKCVEEEEIEKEIDVYALLQSHRHLCRGISPLAGGRPEPTITVDSPNFDDGSADVSEKCPGLTQQADHFKCLDPSSAVHGERQQV